MSAETGLEAAVKAAYADVIAWQKEAREALWRAPSHRQVEATIRAQYERAEALQAKLDLIRLAAEAMAALAPADDWGLTPGDTVASDVGRAILAIINRDEEAREPSTFGALDTAHEYADEEPGDA